MTWDLRMPSAKAASRCPLGTASTPARSTSASTEPLYRVRPVTSAQSGWTFSATKTKKIITSSGIARKNSTTSVDSQRTTRWSESRPAARSAPNGSANSTVQPNASRVLRSPRSSSSWTPRYSNGIHFW